MTRRTRRTAWGMAILSLLAACGGKDAKPNGPRKPDRNLTPAERDAEALGREVFQMVDRAIEYRGSHRGRPAASIRQLGVDSLTPTMVRRVVNLDRSPIITVAFRRPQDHEIIACRGDGQILEDAAVSGRFTLMCTTSSGDQRPIQVDVAPAS